MGCNTSQELIAKDVAATTPIHVHEVNANNGVEENEENVVTEQNATNEVEQQPNFLQQKEQLFNNTINTNVHDIKLTTTTSAAIVTTAATVITENTEKSKRKLILNQSKQHSIIITVVPTTTTTTTTTTTIHNNHLKIDKIVDNGDAMMTLINHNTQSVPITTNTTITSATVSAATVNGTATETIVMAITTTTSSSSSSTMLNCDNTQTEEQQQQQQQQQKQRQVPQQHQQICHENLPAKENGSLLLAINGHIVHDNDNDHNNHHKNHNNDKQTYRDHINYDAFKMHLNNDFKMGKEEELYNAARKIQATFRGHLTRKVIHKYDNEGDGDDNDGGAEELDIDFNDPKLHKAATKIQASYRGHKLRKDISLRYEKDN